MNCVELEAIERYMSGELKATERDEFEGHLKDCPACMAKVGEATTNEKLLTELRKFHKESLLLSKYSKAGIESTDRAQTLVGERYRVIRKVGEGSAGQVFQAIDTVLERLVAIKFLRPRSSPNGADAEAWQEARLMSRFNDPNIAQIYEIGEIEDQRFIMMEWIDGLPLTEAWEGLPLQQKLRIYLGVLDGVAAAHRRNIIHRDLKPSNILVTSGLKPKVLDFGISLETSPLEGIEQGLYRGTPAYSAPEQICPPVKIYPATDVFALGILLYELLTDTHPFPQTSPEELFESIRTEYPELPSAVREKTPIPLQNICLKALEKDPHKRYPNAKSLSDDIHRYLRGEKVWSRPSFLTDKVHQDVFYHRQKLKVWYDNELLTEKEFDKLDNIYERMISPADFSIIEARKLSLSQVCLYLGGWIVVLGSFVLFYKTWDHISIYWRPVPALVATALMGIFGLVMWQRKDYRLSVGFLSTANLLIPITILLTLGQWEVLSPANYPLGTESLYAGLKEAASHVIVGNIQLFASSLCWLMFSLALLRITRSLIFVVFSIIAFLALLTTCYIIAGMENWSPDIIAGRYLYPGIVLFVAGVWFDRHAYIKYAWPLCATGLALIVLPLSIIARSENTLFGWLYRRPEFLSEAEHQLLSFVCNGVFYLSLAGICRLMGTRLQRVMAQVLNWLGPLHILAVLRMLDNKEYNLPEFHYLIYRFLLPIASIGFVFGSVARQMKSFFFSGLAGIAASAHKFTVEHLDKFFAWPISLIITGIFCMFISWMVPRWKANRKLRHEE